MNKNIECLTNFIRGLLEIAASFKRFNFKAHNSRTGSIRLSRKNFNFGGNGGILMFGEAPDAGAEWAFRGIDVILGSLPWGYEERDSR